MPVESLYFRDVGPFGEVSFDFDRQVNMFIGPNNSGKTTVLWVLAELLVYPFTMPSKYYNSDKPNWQIEINAAQGISRRLEGNLPADVELFEEVYDVIGHTSFVPAQRHTTDYRSEGPLRSQEEAARIDEDFREWTQARPELLKLHSEDSIREAIQRMRITGNPELVKRRSLIRSNASLMSDEAIIQKIIDLDYAAYRLHRPEMRSIVDKVASMASEITKHFPIERLAVKEDTYGLFPEVRVPFGDIPLNVLSQGTRSIIQFLAHFLFGYAEYYDFPSNFGDKPAILIIDEIDAHLHPSWQRRILPTLTKHFPSLQIFCSTHSPLMLAGLQAGQIQLLDLHDDASITVSTNETDVFGWTADEILRNLLDISSPTDLRTLESLQRLDELELKESLSPSETNEYEELHRILSKSLTSSPSSAQVLEFASELQRAREELSLLTDVSENNQRDTQEVSE